MVYPCGVVASGVSPIRGPSSPRARIVAVHTSVRASIACEEALTNDQRSLVCRVGSRLCALPAEHVIETMRPLPVQELPGAPRSLRGVARIRGAAVPVVDLAVVLGAEDGQPTRFVTVNAGGRRVALAVDSVVGVRVLPAGSLPDLPPLLHDASTEAIAAIGTRDAELLLVLRASHLVPAGVWDALEQGGVSP